MRAYKCDICGGFFDKWQKLAVRGVREYLVKQEGKQAIDICPRCLEAIENVINGFQCVGDHAEGNNG